MTADRADSAADDVRTDSPIGAGTGHDAGSGRSDVPVRNDVPVRGAGPADRAGSADGVESAGRAGSAGAAVSIGDGGGRMESIGRFARGTGLSIGALRHYADLGLLEPAAVDAATGYRYYRSDQVETARLIGTLRDLEVGLPAIAAILAGTDADREQAIRDHLARTEAAAWRLQRLAHRLRMLLAERHDLTTEREKIMPSSTFALDPDDERRLAAALFNRTWELLLKPERSIADDDEMIHAAHASRHHWGVVGKPVHFARGEWQCSRVYSVLGRAEPALHHASRCLSLATENDLSPFDIGAANEAMARAYRVAGDAERVAAHVAAADEAAAQITNAEDRKILDDDLADLRP